MQKAVTFLAVSLFFGVLSAESRDASEILNEIDDMWRGKSSYALFTMKVKTANYTRSMTMRAWSSGKEKTLVRILAPVKEKGSATLKSGNNIYTYLPKTDRTIKLTSGMMMGAWMGSHFTNDDLVKESRLQDDYNVVIGFEGERDGESVIEFSLTPKPDAPVVWGKIVIEAFLLKDGGYYLPLKERFYDEDMEVVRTMTFSGLKELGGRKLQTIMRVIPADEPDEFTEVIYETLEFNEEIPDSFFSLSGLRRMK